MKFSTSTIGPVNSCIYLLVIENLVIEINQYQYDRLNYLFKDYIDLETSTPR